MAPTGEMPNGRGLDPQAEALLCTWGKKNCEAGQALLGQWWEDASISEGNLFWGIYRLNRTHQTRTKNWS